MPTTDSLAYQCCDFIIKIMDLYRDASISLEEFNKHIEVKLKFITKNIDKIHDQGVKDLCTMVINYYTEFTSIETTPAEDEQKIHTCQLDN